MGNGAKAAQTRAKNAEKGPKEAKSQLKSVRILFCLSRLKVPRIDKPARGSDIELY